MSDDRVEEIRKMEAQHEIIAFLLQVIDKKEDLIALHEETKEKLLDDVEFLKVQLQRAKKGLEFYANEENFELGKIIVEDVEPAIKIEGSLISHKDDIPEKTQTWVGGKLARRILKEIGEG